MVTPPYPQRAYLPGRTRSVTLCCAEFETCNTALELVAEFLANEMGYQLHEAVNKGAIAYQLELGADRCSLERARELRRMTAARCEMQTGGLRGAGTMLLADEMYETSPAVSEYLRQWPCCDALDVPPLIPPRIRLAMPWAGVLVLIGIGIWL